MSLRGLLWASGLALVAAFLPVQRGPAASTRMAASQLRAISNNESGISGAAVTGEVLARSLPYIQRYAGEFIVVKYGGHAMVDEALAKQFASDMVLLKAVGINVIIVHGGGPQIKDMLTKLDIESKFVEGLRVTDEATMEVAEMVLSGPINKGIVSAIQLAGGKAVGLSGKDGNILRTKKAEKEVVDPESGRPIQVDLGLVGEPDVVDVSLLRHLSAEGVIPVVAPVGVDAKGRSNNVNADTAAGAIAGALQAKRLMLLTDVAGVLDKNMKLLTQLSLSDVSSLVADGTISGGMVPKLQVGRHPDHRPTQALTLTPI
mmetsp:Transcript_6998/g.20439  ORF Transcript_6998/g.20439 Transcript_6998/m.20439 type:complete len:317 (-) Transcript_6998:326-1276(-)